MERAKPFKLLSKFVITSNPKSKTITMNNRNLLIPVKTSEKKYKWLPPIKVLSKLFPSTSKLKKLALSNLIGTFCS